MVGRFSVSIIHVCTCVCLFTAELSPLRSCNSFYYTLLFDETHESSQLYYACDKGGTHTLSTLRFFVGHHDVDSPSCSCSTLPTVILAVLPHRHRSPHLSSWMCLFVVKRACASVAYFLWLRSVSSFCTVGGRSSSSSNSKVRHLSLSRVTSFDRYPFIVWA